MTPGETLGTLYNIHVGSNKTKQHRQWAPGAYSGCMQDLLLADVDENFPLNLLILFGLCSLSLSTHGVVGGVIPALQSWLWVRESLCLRHPFLSPPPSASSLPLRYSSLSPAPLAPSHSQ